MNGDKLHKITRIRSRAGDSLDGKPLRPILRERAATWKRENKMKPKLTEGELFYLRMIAYMQDKPRTPVGMRLLINEILEGAYSFARGQDVPDRFTHYGKNQQYWRGRSDAADAIRKLKSKVPIGSEEQSEPHLRKPKRTALDSIEEGASGAPRGGHGGEDEG